MMISVWKCAGITYLSALFIVNSGCNFNGAGLAPTDAPVAPSVDARDVDARTDGIDAATDAPATDAPTTDAPTPDAGPDAADPDAADPDAAPPDAEPPDDCDLGFDPSNIDCDDIASPTGDFHVKGKGNVIIDTDNLMACPMGLTCQHVTQAGGGPEVMVASTNSMQVDSDAQVTIQGRRPLILVSLGSVQVDGTLLVTPRPPPDANFCAPDGRGEDAISGSTDGPGAGGGGGGFGSAGGDGGEVDDLVAAGVANGTNEIVPLRGGCRGGVGGAGQASGDEGVGGAGGTGGGALQISAQSIAVQGQVLAPGAGGQGAQGSGPEQGCGAAGGGGGGAGGAVLLEAPDVQLKSGSTVAANGGGGGAGCDGGDRNPAGDGENGLNARPGVNGEGGSAEDAGDGGDGRAAGRSATDSNGGAEEEAGAGGGGGGLGRIRINADTVLFDGALSGTCTRATLDGTAQAACGTNP